MTKPTRTFSADVGQLSVGNAGPDAIENDIDQLCRMFDPLQDGGGIQNENIADGAVTDAKIATACVTAAKLMDGAVTESKIFHGAVTNSKISSGAITTDKLTGGCVTDTVIGNRTVSDASAPTGDTGFLTTLLGWLANMIKSITGKANWRTAPATTLEDANEHINATTAHGATSLATGNTMIVRDELGRASIGAPSTAQHIARKDTVDAVQANLDAHGLDYIRNPGFGITSGTASDFTLTLNPAPTGYVNGMRILVRFHADPITSGFATINVNELGPVQLCTSTYDDYGTYYYFPPGMIKAHTHNVYEFVYVGGSNKFVLVGGRTDVMFYKHAQSAVLDHPNGSVTKDKIATGAVDTAQLADGAVTGDKLADEAVDTAQLADGSVTGAKLATAITGAKEFRDGLWVNNFDNYGRIAFGTAEDVLATSGDGLKFNEALLADRNYVDTVVQGATAAQVTATTQDIVYYVDAVNGNDNNDGLTSGTALKTITAAVNKIPQVVNHLVVIYVATGIYDEIVTISGFSGKGSIRLRGNSILSETRKVIRSSILDNSILIRITGFYSSEVYDENAIRIERCRFVEIEYCKCYECDGNGVYVRASNVQVQNCEFSDSYAGIGAAQCSVVFSKNNTGTGNTYGLMAESASKIGKSGTQPQGTTAESIADGGQIL